MELINKNDINILLQKMPKTPRMCLNLFFKVNKKQKFNGINSIMARLLLQGTKKYSALQLAQEFENECIDISVKSKQDYIKMSVVFLNEDLKLAFELVRELLLNSTFDGFEKEIFKLKGEIASDLDNPRFKLSDCFVKNIFQNHPYSETHTNILETLDKISKEDILNAYKDMFLNQKAVVLVGDWQNQDEIVDLIKSNFDFMTSKNTFDEIENIFLNHNEKDETLWLTKNDAQQAQIIQGCLVESFNSNKTYALTLMNNILGGSGLSCRLFVNLRDKQGLAYTVRSQYETLLHSAIFNMYIGTAPQNIKKSLEGFKIELSKLAQDYVSDEELIGAKESISGRLKYFTQNNAQIAAVNGYNYIMGLGLDYNDKFLDEIKKITKDDIKNIANEILNKPKLNVIICPDEYRY